MASKDKAPFFSIIIFTRNRPELFQVALHSVLEQSFSDKEIIVIIDGSTNSNLARYRGLEKPLEGVFFFELEDRPIGHGQSYTANYGVSKSSGQYLCFLDDDDHWTDNEYLARVFDNLSACRSPVDVHYSNQKAIFSNGVENRENLWIEDLIPRVAGQEKNYGDSCYVDAKFLLSSAGFAHINCSIFKREFFLSIGQMDEAIRYENDRDIYIRSIDAATVILFSTSYISMHTIPDASSRNNLSTTGSDLEKKLYQLRVHDKGISFSKNSHVARFCCKAKMYEMKHAARILAQRGQYRGAAHYAKAALIDGFNLRWLAYTIYLWFKSLTNSSEA